MIRQSIQNSKLGSLNRTKVTASSRLALLMTFAEDIGLCKLRDLRFSHLTLRLRANSVSAKILMFLQMIIKAGDRFSYIDLLRIDGVPRPNMLPDLARRFRGRDIHRLAECTMRPAVRVLGARKVKRVIVDIDSTFVESGVRIAERTDPAHSDSFL